MALITSNGTGGGLASATTTWAGGVVPAALDDVTIAAGDVVIRDTALTYNSLTVNGTDKLSRGVSSSLSVTGNITYNAGAGFDGGTAVDPILTGVTHSTTITCASLAQYGITFNNTATASSKSNDSRLLGTTITSDIAIGGKVFTVAAASGWQVGDELVFESPVQGQTAGIWSTTIQAIAGLSITTAGTAPYACDGTLKPFILCNVTQPISFLSGDVTEALHSLNPYFTINRSTATPINAFYMQDFVIRGFGQGNWNAYGAITIKGGWHEGHASAGVVFPQFTNVCMFNNFGGFQCLNGRATGSNVAVVSDGTHLPWGNSRFLNAGGDSETVLSNVLALNQVSLLGGLTFLTQLTNVSVSNCMYLTTAQPSIDKVTGGVARHLTYVARFGLVRGNTVISGVAIDDVFALGQFLAFGNIYFKSCTFSNITNHITGGSLVGIAHMQDYNSPTDQRVYTGYGSFYRDTVVALSPASKPASIRLESGSTYKATAYEVSRTLFAGQALTVTVMLRADPLYNGAVRPLIRVVGVEFDVTQQMSATNNAFELVTLTTPVAVLTHQLTLSIEAIGTAGAVWFDDLTIAGAIHDAGQILFAGGTEISNVIDITDTLRHFVLTGLQPNTEVRVYRDSDGVELFGVENSGTTFDYAYNYTAPVPITVNILNVQYVWEQIKTTLTNASTSIPIQQRFDRNYL